MMLHQLKKNTQSEYLLAGSIYRAVSIIKKSARDKFSLNNKTFSFAHA
jgi:hypothetical protein